MTVNIALPRAADAMLVVFAAVPYFKTAVRGFKIKVAVVAEKSCGDWFLFFTTRAGTVSEVMPIELADALKPSSVTKNVAVS